MRIMHGRKWRTGTSTVKRSLLSIALIFISAIIAHAATIYVDAGCTVPGNGSGGYSSTCDATAAGNPATTISQALSASSCGDTINIRGSHSSHGSCTSGSDGRFGADSISLTKACTAGNILVIQANGWTAIGAATQESVYIEGAAAPGSGANLGWTQCSDCSATSPINACRGVPSTCGDVWWTNSSAVGNPGNMSKSIGAVRPDGVMTYRELPSSCDPTTCAAGGTCGTALDVQYDSCSAQSSGATLAVRWGASTPNSTNKPYVFFDNNGFGFAANGAAYVTIRGITFRNIRRNALSLEGSANNIIFQDNTCKYMADTYGNGSDHCVSAAVPGTAYDITIDSNDFSYNGSETIHTQARTSAVATAYTITNNYMHSIGDQTVMGPGVCGTPSGMIITDDGTGGLSNYNGTVISGNLIATTADHPGCSAGRGIILENNVENLIVRDNVIANTAAEGIKIDPSSSGHGDNLQIFNNLIISNGGGGNGNAFWVAPQGSAGTVTNLALWNNTCINPASGCLSDNGVGTYSGNVIANNIFYSTSSMQLVDYHSTATFRNNDVKSTTSGTLVGFGGINYTCATIGALGTGNICLDPLFSNAASNNYHIQTTSPAKDTGTSIGMPSSHTRDINNTISSSHGFPSYADGQAQAGSAWDMGIDEFSTGGTVTLTIGKTDSPDPVVPGNNITYTLAYQNTGSTSATGVVITDTIPANTTFVSATGGGTSNGTTVTWSIGTVAAGASGSVQMVVLVTSPLADNTVISNSTYSIVSNESSSVSGVADTTTVSSLPVLLVSMSDAPDPVLAGNNITYTIFYSNTGTAGATNVVITDVVPSNTTFVSATNGGTNNGGTVTWTIGAVNAGTFSSVQMVVTASASLSNGATVTNSTYTLASSELSTINGTPISTGVIAAITTIPQPKFPITSRQNGWVQTQTLLFDGAADVIQTPNIGQWIRGQASENLTLSTSGTTTDTSANLLPANAIIEAVTARVTTSITVAANWKLGDAAQSARFTAAQTGLTAGTTVVGLNQADPTVASADLGPVQSSAAKVRVTCNTTPGAGAIRITVFYRQFVPPTN